MDDMGWTILTRETKEDKPQTLIVGNVSNPTRESNFEKKFSGCSYAIHF
jgi:hypothetical protein